LPRPEIKDKPKQALAAGYIELKKVWNELTNIPRLKRFLTAYFFYNMAVQTVMLAAALYGKSELQIPTENLIISIILIQLVAIPGAIVISRLPKLIGNLQSLIVCVIVWIAICMYGYMIPAKDVNQFYILATIVGFVMGGIQSLSRSTYSKLMPVTKDTTSFFSFFDVTEKVAIVIGMFSFGYITELTGSQRNAVLSLVVEFLLGLLLLLYTLRAKPSPTNEALHN
jgi:UMF1 family MFS transporter